jgi:outer membrane protein, heavy metal efflux system
MSQIGAVLACALLAAPLHARTSLVVTLSSLGDRVRSQNPDLTAARYRVNEAVARASGAGRLANPQLETSFEHNSSFREGRLEVGFSQRFPVTGRLRLEKELSATSLRAAEAEIRDVERRLVADARSIALKVLVHQQRRELIRHQAGIARGFADFLTESSARGESSPLDVADAKLEAASLDVRIRRIDAETAALVDELKPLLGMRAGESLTIGGALPHLALPAGGGDPSRRPDMQRAQLDAGAAAQEVAIEQSRRYEDVEGGIFAAAERSEDVPAGYDKEAIIGIRFKIPLPLWNNNDPAIAAAGARQQRVEAEAAALARNIRLEAEAARAGMREWTGILREIDQTLLPLAENQCSLAETAWRGGQGTMQSLLLARSRLLDLSGSRLDALLELHLAHNRHLAALGSL